MTRWLTIAGLFLTLIGAGLLFFYGMPRKKIGNVLIRGDQAMVVGPDEGEEMKPHQHWQHEANKFLARATFLNRSGFALIALGTLLQIFAVNLSHP